MDAAVRRHDAIIREVTQATNGFIVESGREGDSVLVSFGKATDAVGCAVALQLRFATETWPVGQGLAVRIAIHTGEAEFRDGHYYGQPINRCARLLATGHGGQILLTSGTRDLVLGSLPDRTSLTDLGRHQFKDLREPEYVFQVVHPDLRSVFPALRTLESPSTLPVQLTSFVGREDVLAELRKEIPRTRLLTLTGSGGSGKTRLAIQLASEVAADLPDGIWFVDLVPLADSSLITPKVMSSIGLREQADRPALTTLVEFLATKRALLILDNCEHLIDSVVPLVDSLLRASTELTILATSREVLRLPGELIWQVPPLSVPSGDQAAKAEDLLRWDAIRLFTERAASNLAGFSLTPENAGAVAAVCRQLDGLPLAIELAAARTASMSPTQFLARLGDRLKLLSRSSRIASPKQQTLEATFDWSYELLDSRERTLFRRLGVFSSPFTLEDVEAVCSGDGIAVDDVVDLIGQLTDKSLVVSQRRNNDEIRYRLLETVRRYARSRLAELGEEEALKQALAHFSYSIAEQAIANMHSANTVAWMDILDEQSDNTRAALGWYRSSDPAAGSKLASFLAEYWDFRGQLTEGRMWLGTFLDLDQTAGPTRAGALRGAGLLAWRQGDCASAQGYYAECLAIGRSTKDEELVARALRGMADALFSLGDYSQAETLCRESLATFRRLGVPAETAETLSRLGNTILIQGDVPASIPLYEESLALYRQLGDRVGIANQLWSLGGAESIRGEHVRGRPQLEECLSIRREIKDELGIPYALNTLAYLNTQLGDFSVARSQLHAAITRLLELGDRWGVAMAFDGMVGLAAAEKKMPDVLNFAGAADAVRASIGAQQLAWMKAPAEAHLAEARRHMKPDEADQAYRHGLHMTLEDSVQFAVGYLAAGEKSVTKAGPRPPLSRRELEVARLVSEGRTNREIATALFISERTVDNHVKHILDKLHFRSRSQIGAWLTEADNSPK